ncbi:MAG: DUF1513 domain-containing protein [Pseudomonadota bacterium]|nr:DUF1513 domain-containing protein [Pseudomonadota bacterium]
MPDHGAIDRRDFLAAAGAAFAAMLEPRAAAALEDAEAVFAAAYRAPDGHYGVATLAPDGAVVHAWRLPGRGHDVVTHPASGRSAVFARRPGTFGVAFDARFGQPPRSFSAPPGRHFYGHGAYSADGRLLYATENDFDNARGVIGVYDATDGYGRTGELASHGVGPHEVLLMPDGHTLAVANGGIETHPDFGRTILNAAAMQPSIAFVDTKHGDLVARHELPKELSRLSTRHLDVDAEGRLWFGCQYHGEPVDAVPLVGNAAAGEPLRWLKLPREAGSALLNYVGSIAVNRRSGVVGITSPKGNAAVEIRPDDPRGAVIRRLDKVSGLAPAGAGFAYASMAGGFDGRATLELWDNHVRPI